MRTRRIMLIEPPVTVTSRAPAGQRAPVVPPLGIASVGAVLENAGFDVLLLDAFVEGFRTPSATMDGRVRYGLADDEIAERIREFDPEIVGVSCIVTNRHRDAHAVCALAKQAAPRCLTVMGGAHVTTMPELVMADPAVDVGVLGEGDLTLLKVIERLDADQSLAGLDGVTYRAGGSLVIQEKTEYVQDLDSLPWPARHLLPMELYWEIGQPHGDLLRTPFATVMTSRGCPARCIFCSSLKLWGSRYRPRSAGNVLDELQHLIDVYGVREIHFEDDNLTASRPRAKEIFQGMVDRGFDLSWSTPNGLMVATLDEEIVDLMAASGCYAVSLAIESGCQRVLDDVIHKPLDLERVASTVSLLRSAGIHTKGFFMLGLPGETREEIAETIAFARGAGFDWSAFHIATPLPGTEMYRICEERGYLTGDFDLSELKYTIGSISTEEFDPAYLEGEWARADEEVNYAANPNVREGRLDQALADFRRVAALYPGHRFAFAYLGQVYERLGRVDEAAQAYATALRNDPENVRAREGASRLGLATP